MAPVRIAAGISKDAGRLSYGAFVLDEMSAVSRYILLYIADADAAIHR